MRKWFTVQSGERFGKWTVITNGNTFSSCRCDCGYITNVRTNNLLRNKSTQCRSCSITSRNKQISRWEGDLDKYPPRLRMAVKNAILRGIKVYQPWVDNRVLFVEYLITLEGWDDESLWLDRINNDGNYEPGNLRWVTPSVSRVNSHRDD